MGPSLKDRSLFLWNLRTSFFHDSAYYRFFRARERGGWGALNRLAGCPQPLFGGGLSNIRDRSAQSWALYEPDLSDPGSDVYSQSGCRFSIGIVDIGPTLTLEAAANLNRSDSLADIDRCSSVLRNDN